MKFSYNKLFFILLLNVVGLVSFSQNKTYVPDDNFEAYLEANGMGDGIANNDSVNTSSIINVTLLDVSNQNIDSLIGIQDFTAITELNCNNNQLSSLDVTQNTALSELYCINNQISSLNVTQNTPLAKLICHNNQLSSLDVTQNTALTDLKCQINQLSSLDVTQNTALTDLGCYNNQLSILDVTQNTALTELICHNNQLSSLDVTQNTVLTRLLCGTNQLSSLDVTQNTVLTELRFNNNQLSSLDVTQNTSLTSLFCSNNQLSSLDVTQNTSLTWLFCSNNQLSSLDVTQNTALTQLGCSNNQLTILNLKNGNNTNFSNFNARLNSNLFCILVDDANWASANWTVANNNIDAQTSFNNSYPNFSTVADFAICQGDSIMLHGTSSENLTYNWNNGVADSTFFVPDSTRSYIVTASDSISCSTTDTVLVTVNNPITVNDSIVACDSIIWNGNTYTTSGIYIDTLQTIAGCDSIVNLNTTIYLSYLLDTSIIVCDSAIWNGIYYTSSRVYTDSLQTINGCDSIINLNISINNSYHLDTNITACDSAIWNGIYYTSSGVYTDSLQTINGCDSVINLNISINSSYHLDTSITACDSVNLPPPYQTLYNSGVYIDSLQTINGCDSILTLNLTINNSYNFDSTIMVCDSLVWNSITYSSSGIYSDSLQTINGCDSILTLDLTISDNPESLLDTLLLPECDGISIVFENISDQNLNSFWSINNSDSLFGKSHEIKFEFGDTVEATLFVEDNQGCKDSTTMELHLDYFDNYFHFQNEDIPNVFTPNSDQENDIFTINIPGRLDECTVLSIFNRWGQRIFISYGETPIWRGKNYAGQELPTGPYFYHLSIKDKSYDGSIHLFR